MIGPLIVRIIWWQCNWVNYCLFVFPSCKQIKNNQKRKTFCSNKHVNGSEENCNEKMILSILKILFNANGMQMVSLFNTTDSWIGNYNQCLLQLQNVHYIHYKLCMEPSWIYTHCVLIFNRSMYRQHVQVDLSTETNNWFCCISFDKLITF